MGGSGRSIILHTIPACAWRDRGNTIVGSRLDWSGTREEPAQAFVNKITKLRDP
jgi:hypothetical protein